MRSPRGHGGWLLIAVLAAVRRAGAVHTQSASALSFLPPAPLVHWSPSSHPWQVSEGSTAAWSPPTLTGALRNEPVAVFNATTSPTAGLVIPGSFAGDAAVSVFVLHRWAPGAAPSERGTILAGAGGSPWLVGVRGDGVDCFTRDDGSIGRRCAPASASPVAHDTEWRIHTFVSSGAGSAAVARADTQLYNGPGTGPRAGIAIAAGSSAWVAEVLVYNRSLSFTQRQLVVCYLALRYGLVDEVLDAPFVCSALLPPDFIALALSTPTPLPPSASPSPRAAVPPPSNGSGGTLTTTVSPIAVGLSVIATAVVVTMIGASVVIARRRRAETEAEAAEADDGTAAAQGTVEVLVHNPLRPGRGSSGGGAGGVGAATVVEDPTPLRGAPARDAARRAPHERVQQQQQRAPAAVAAPRRHRSAGRPAASATINPLRQRAPSQHDPAPPSRIVGLQPQPRPAPTARLQAHRVARSGSDPVPAPGPAPAALDSRAALLHAAITVSGALHRVRSATGGGMTGPGGSGSGSESGGGTGGMGLPRRSLPPPPGGAGAVRFVSGGAAPDSGLPSPLSRFPARPAAGSIVDSVVPGDHAPGASDSGHATPSPVHGGMGGGSLATPSRPGGRFFPAAAASPANPHSGVIGRQREGTQPHWRHGGSGVGGPLTSPAAGSLSGVSEATHSTDGDDSGAWTDTGTETGPGTPSDAWRGRGGSQLLRLRSISAASDPRGRATSLLSHAGGPIVSTAAAAAAADPRNRGASVNFLAPVVEAAGDEVATPVLPPRLLPPSHAAVPALELPSTASAQPAAAAAAAAAAAPAMPPLSAAQAGGVGAVGGDAAAGLSLAAMRAMIVRRQVALLRQQNAAAAGRGGR
jgi:hypothetical protein